ncbi:hypothetical protein Ahy_B06g084065 [Arachis hypogaea]|uniref:Transposase MuDR plant domain-containing protein n=1 Tax=Arachis hypogaea TaxID=3818 RepID=A0A444YR74_ARAHY|nr:hypothetical protein Ahy_B06g084065 [Arachis hypogaea]
MFSMYIESRTQISFIELYIEFEQSKADRNIERKDYNSDSEEEFESNYKVVGLDRDEDQGDGSLDPNMTDVANALANEHLFEEPSFMRALDFKAMHASEFPEYMNAGCDWLIKVSMISRKYSMISRKYCWVIRRQNEVFKVREMPSGMEYAVDNDVNVRDQVGRVYRARFKPLGNHTTWPAYNGSRFVPNLFLRQVTKGRPRMTRFLNKMDTQMLCGPRRCRQCGAEAHSHSRCRQSGGSSADNNAQ